MKKIILYISLIGNVLLIAILIRSAMFYNANMRNPSYQGEFVAKNSEQQYLLGNSAGNSAGGVVEKPAVEAKVEGEKAELEVKEVAPQAENQQALEEAREIEIGEEAALEANQQESIQNVDPNFEEENKIAQSAREAVAQAVKQSEITNEIVHSHKDIIASVESSYRNSLLSVMINANKNIDAKSYILDNPVRLVVDVKGTWELPKIPDLPQNAFARRLRTGYQKGITRFVIDMREANFTYDLQDRGNSLQLFIFFDTSN